MDVAASQLCQYRVLAECFDTFCESFQFQLFRHCQDSRQHVLLASVDIATGDVTAVNFDPVYGKASDVGNGGMTGTVVVEINPDTPFALVRGCCGE